MDTIKKIYSHLFGKNATGTEDVEYVTEIIKKRKKRVKSETRKLKERINKKKKKRQQRNEKRIQYNKENNINFGYESPTEYVLDETTNEDSYYSIKRQAAENYKNKIIHKTNMTTKEFYKELEQKEKAEFKTENESESDSRESQ